jgi:hypothetical protein
VLEDLDRADDGGGAVRAAAQLGQDLPGLEVGNGSLPRARIIAWCLLTDFCHHDSRVQRRLNEVQMIPPDWWMTEKGRRDSGKSILTLELFDYGAKVMPKRPGT